jgi:PAS domain-containing protein
MRVVEMDWEGERAYLASLRDITERKRAEEERKKLILQLQDALEKVKTLSGLLPICSFCKKIRDDDGYWNKIETYIEAHSEAEFSHSMCQECAKKHYPQIYGDKDQEE